MLAGASQTAAKLLIMTFADKMHLPTRLQMNGVIPWLVRWARRAGTIEFYPASAALVSPVQNIFFSSIYVSPIAQQPGKAVVQGRLSLNVCLR
jgi:hypothetical protein